MLKSLITEPTLTIEAKYQNAVQMPNYVHLMMASNENWVIPASLEARRFLVLEVPASRVNDTAYFAAIWGEMENGGYEAMLHDLLEYDLTFFNHRNAPRTAGLMEQKKLSLGTSEAWWLDVLHRGYVWKSKLGLEEYFGEWQSDFIATDLLYDAYTEFAKAKHERHAMARGAFGAFITGMGGMAARPSKGIVGEHLTDVTNKFGETRRQAAKVEKDRPTGYRFGSLQDARMAFIKKTNLSVGWGDEEKGNPDDPDRIALP